MQFCLSSFVVYFSILCTNQLYKVFADYGAKRWRRIALADVILNDPTPTTSTYVRSVSQCGSLCFNLTPVCKTFAFNKLNKRCMIFTNRVFAKGTIVSNESGLRYYWTYEDNCRPGYSYDATEHTCIQVTKPFIPTTNWKTNQGKCEQDGGYLYIMDTVFKQTYIKTVIQSQGKSLSAYGAGGGDSLTEGNHVWLDGASILPSMFPSGQPDDYGGEDCLDIIHESNIYKPRDINCNNWANYICEIPVL